MANLTTYTDEQRAHALAVLTSNNGNAKKTERETGIPRTTLRQWAGRAKSSTAHPPKVDPAKVAVASSELGEKWRAVANMAVDRAISVIGEVEVKNASDVRNLLWGGGIATDKAQLLTGGPTSRVQQLQVTLIGAGSLAELGGSVLKALNPGTQGAHNVATRDTPAPE